MNQEIKNRRKKILSIVIPAYNEGKYIIETLKKVLSANTSEFQKEIIIIDDASTDNTVDLIKKFMGDYQKKNAHSTIKLIEKEYNEGKGSGLKLGLQKTTGDIVLVQDADLEYNPDEYPYLLEPFVTNDADIVYGSRFSTPKPHRVLYFWHYVANIFLTLLSNMFTNLNLTDMETGYKVFKGDLIRGIAPQLKCKRFGFEPEITARISKYKNIKIYEVGISYWGRTYEEGKKIGFADGIRALWEIIYFNLFI